MKYVGMLLVLALGAVAYVLEPPEPPEPRLEAPAMAVPVAVCAVEEGSGRSTSLTAASTVDGPVSLTLFASGSTAGSIGHRTGPAGAVTIPVVDVAAVGTVGGLIELPNSSSSVGSLVSGAESMSYAPCSTEPHPLTFIGGATTASGDAFVLHLMNPYAGEAVVELTVQSEAGVESNQRFESVIVPPRASALIDFTELVPGREFLGVTIETTRGRAFAVARQGIGGESAVWRGVPPGQDWFLPIPAGVGRREIVIATPNDAPVEYQVDFYGPDGLEEALVAGVLPARGQDVFDVASLTDEAAAVRVVSAGPIVATLWLESDTGLGVATGSPDVSNRWFLPGAGSPVGGWATAVILNVGIEESAVTVRPLIRGSSAQPFLVEPGSVLEVGLQTADGYLIESVDETVVLWSAHRGEASTASLGVPLSDG